MNESKLTYIALALSAGAILISAVSAGLSALPNTAKIDTLAGQVIELRARNESLQQQLSTSRQNRSRIDELDVGLTALATVMKIDRNELAKAIAATKADGSRAAPKQPAAADTNMAIAAVAQKSAPSATTPPGTASSADTVQGRAKAPAVEPVNPSVTTASPKPSPAAGLPVDGAAMSLPEADDNPFAAAMDGTGNPGGEVPPPLAIATASVSAPQLTIEHVDSVLAKRISESWYKPAGAAEDLSAIIQVKMTRDGKVSSVVLTKPSGNTAFDTSVISAVKSIVAIDEVRQLSDSDFQKAYASRNIQFTPQMGG